MCYFVSEEIMASLPCARVFILGSVFLTHSICESSSKSDVPLESAMKTQLQEVLDKFLCALNLIRQSIQKFHDRVILEVLIKGEPIGKLDVLPFVPAYIFKGGKEVIVDLLPKNQSEDSINRAFNLYRKFYNGLWFGNSTPMEMLLYNLSSNGYEKWRFSSILAGFYELADTYLDQNLTQAIKTYIASVKEDDARSFVEIICQYKNWTLFEEDMKMINICRMLMGDGKIAYETVPRGYSKVALPLQDLNKYNKTCI